METASGASASTTDSVSYTCITCHVSFRDAEMQRQHYKIDWHRYNLKRKIVDLPPVSSEEFQERVLIQRSKDEEATKLQTVYCNPCRKTFSSVNAYTNHLNSKKHIDNVMIQDNMSDSALSTLSSQEVSIKQRARKTSSEDDLEMEEVDSDVWDEDTEIIIADNNCLFCPHHSRNMMKNLNHMTISHSFFIPDIDFCIDIKGLLLYLGEKVYQYYMCLWCNDRGKAFHTYNAAQRHMSDKGHCKMLHEGMALAEYADFYDYSSSYPDAKEDDVDLNAEVDVPVLDDTDYQLVLPSGAVIGHRSLLRYYKQRITSTAIAKSNRNKINEIVSQYKSLGWVSTQKEAAVRKARDINFMKNWQSKHWMKLGVKANKFQPHFRQQVNY